jgi:hypothetical protein
MVSYENRKFMEAFHWSLSWVSQIKFTISHFSSLKFILGLYLSFHVDVPSFFIHEFTDKLHKVHNIGYPGKLTVVSFECYIRYKIESLDSTTEIQYPQVVLQSLDHVASYSTVIPPLVKQQECEAEH